MNKPKVLVTYRIPGEGLRMLDEQAEVICPENERFTPEVLSARVDGVEAVITVFGIPFPDELIRKSGSLRIISNYGAGVDNINVELATEKGIVVTNTPGAVTAPTAELTIGLMIALMRRVAECHCKLHSGKGLEWGVMENLGRGLNGKALGIIGMGRIGRATAVRARALGMDIVYHNRHRLDEKAERELEASWLPLPDLLQTADVISLHTPLTRETYHLINGEAFEKMKSGVFLINTSRGPVVDEKELIKNLEGGKVAGAALDVLENEPHIPDALLKMEQVVVVPHIGTATVESREEMSRVAAENLLVFFRGGKPENTVNPEVFNKG